VFLLFEANSASFQLGLASIFESTELSFGLCSEEYAALLSCPGATA